MTEEIIIDECYFCDNGTCNIYPWTSYYDWSCKDNNECEVKKIFLELQRLKQENEKLRKENERLAETPQWRQIKDMANNNKYRKALEEIREIAYTTDFDICDIQKICNEVLDVK